MAFGTPSSRVSLDALTQLVSMMKKLFKIVGGILAVLVVAFVLLVIFAPEQRDQSLLTWTATFGNKSVVIHASDISSGAIEGGTRIRFGDHVVTIIDGVVKLDGKEIDFGPDNKIEITLHDDGELSVE